MKHIPDTFASLISGLTKLENTVFEPKRVTDLLGEVNISASDLAPLLTFQKGGYTRNLVYRSDSFEVIVLCWAANTGTGVHDHGNQYGWVRVLKGALKEVRFSNKGCPAQLDESKTWSPEEFGTTIVPAGRAVASVDSSHGIHRLTAMDQDTVSLHVYSKPLDTCLVFKGQEGEIDRKQLCYDTTPDSRARQLS